MKVLHVIPAVAVRDGGPSKAIIEMCTVLRNKGIETLIATTDADGRGRIPAELGRPFEYQGVPTIFFSRQWTEAFKYSRPLADWLAANVAEFDAVHIHAVFSHSSLAGARACRRRDVPYVIRPLGSLDPWSLKQRWVGKRLLWHLGVKQMLRGAAAIHYTTNEERRLAEETLGLKRGAVVPLGLNLELYQKNAAHNPFSQYYPALGKNPYVLVLSRLHYKKGLEFLVKAFLELMRKPKFQQWRLVVAGRGENGYEAFLKRLVQNGNGDRHIFFPGWLPGAEKMSALHGASLLALPSYQENFGLSALEGLACGVPVLVSPHVNLAEEVKSARAGWVVPLKGEELVATLVEILRNDGERVRRGRAGLELARRFAWPRVADELVKLYRAVIDTGNP